MLVPNGVRYRGVPLYFRVALVGLSYHFIHLFICMLGVCSYRLVLSSQVPITPPSFLPSDEPTVLHGLLTWQNI